MRIVGSKQISGLVLILAATTVFLAVVVYPYSKLLGKTKIDFDQPADVTKQSEVRALPVFGGLRARVADVSSTLFFLTIDRLGIKKAPVRPDIFVDNVRPEYLNSLLAGAAHLKGTPHPGEKGNSVIFGHSALPYLFNPRNFQTIFTTIDELKFGDPILVEGHGQVFKFKVEKGGLLDDAATLADLTSNKARLTLLTCYPPGYKTHRYVVRALLTD